MTRKTKDEIYVYNNGEYERELICAEKWMRLIYENPVGRASLLFLIKRKIISRLYGYYCRTPVSALKIPQFISRYKVDMSGCKGSYKNFADFFAREKTGLVFPAERGLLGSPCEGLASAYAGIDIKKLVAVKGNYFSLSELLGGSKLAAAYEGGSMLKIRLTPANYHRLHFFDDGEVICSEFINGDLYSVNPLAVKRVARLYCRNKRALTLFSSENFGDIVLVEVGATFVGSIVHCFENGEKIKRGDMGGYFLPGGSLLLMFFKKGAFRPSESLLAQTSLGYETKVGVGAVLGGSDKK